MKEENNTRITCYICYRPVSSCMCKYINKIQTNTQFVILMHPKEFRKTKNGTGHFTHLSLKNSSIFIGIDFTNNTKINEIIENKNNNCYILYPGENTIKLNNTSIKSKDKNNVIFIIDSTWACSVKMLRVSKNLHNLPRVSFVHEKVSQFKIKEQPNKYCLSTIESTLCVLELLTKHNIENIKESDFNLFLKPFEKMVEYQITKANSTSSKHVRFKIYK